jgi:hypothetical protein
MKKSNREKIKKSLLLIFFGALLQPYFDVLLLFQYGPANSCMDCLIIQQTFFISLLYIAFSLSLLYLVLNRSNLNSWISSSIIGVFFGVISFYKITLFLFDDRIAAWSTFLHDEIVSNSLMFASPTLFIEMITLTILLRRINATKKL